MAEMPSIMPSMPYRVPPRIASMAGMHHLAGGLASRASHIQLADEFYAPIYPIAAELRRQGLSLRAIARELDRQGIKTRYGCGRWKPTQVKRVLARFQGRRGMTAGDPELSSAETAPAEAELTGEERPDDGLGGCQIAPKC